MFRIKHCVLLLTAVAVLSGLARGQSAKYAIVIHGGAGGDPSTWSAEYQQQRRDGLRAALQRGEAMLRDGAPALDVVEAVVQVMEADATFNAGRGCVLNEQGEHELDASIMDGSNLGCGAVAGVRDTKSPIALARRVMTDTEHVLLMGTGADQFGKAIGLPTADAKYFRTERSKARWRKWRDQQAARDTRGDGTRLSVLDGEPPYMGTVGCVVLDQHGNLAAATSTGGRMGKRWGRVGDSPVVGAGTYADNETCAVSGPGIGEEFIRISLAADVAARMRYAGSKLADAARDTIARLPAKAGGIIAVDAQGNIAVEFNTVGMSHAYADSSGRNQIRLGREN